MTELPISVKIYLSKYAIPNWQLEWNKNNNITHVIVVPAICEFENIQKLLKSISQCDKKFFNETLVIFVVNNSKSSSIEVKIDNFESISFLKNYIDNSKVTDIQIGLIDASTEGNELPEKDAGVGLARKIGMDWALQIFNYQSNSKKIITCLDADCKVETNYITEIIDNFNKNNLSVGVVNFAHDLSDNNENTNAIICYEIFLRYYLLGLQSAGSPYAFQSIGSTLCCDFKSYIKSEGMNKKKAAEDFYFMEKLAKNFPVSKINSTTVYPSARGSWRVPFGTGQSVKRFINKTRDEYLLYNPKSFIILKKWLKIFLSTVKYSVDDYISEAKKINECLHDFLNSNNFKNSFGKVLNNSSSETQFQKQKIRWFDGFKTLKLIHYLRDNGFPLTNMFDALDEMLIQFDKNIIYEKNEGGIPDLEIQKEYLNILRKLT